MRGTLRVLLTVQALLVVALVLVIALVLDNRHAIAKNRQRIDCLVHPHAESSVAGRLVGRGRHRHFVVTQAPHRTGC